MQRIAFLSRHVLDNGLIANLLDQFHQKLSPQSLPRHFASAEEDSRLDLVALAQEPENVILFGLVVVIVHVDAELHFLDRDHLLVFLGFALPLFLLVEVLAEIKNAADWRLGRRGNFHQVHVLSPCDPERVLRCHNAELIPFVVNHADFAYANALIGANKPLIDTEPPNSTKA